MVSTEAILVTVAFLVVGLAFLVGGLFAIKSGRKQQKMVKKRSETETTAIRNLESGTVEIKGTAGPIEGEATLTGPLTGAEGMVRTASVSKWRSSQDGGNWKTVYADTAVRPFLVDDGTGEVVVDPPEVGVGTLEQTTVTVGSDQEPPEQARRFVDQIPEVDAADKGGGLLSSGERRRYREGLIEPGEDVYVFGEAVNSPDEWGTYEITGGSSPEEFVVSDRSEEELQSGGTISYLLLYGIGVIALGIGGVTLLFSLIAAVASLA